MNTDHDKEIENLVKSQNIKKLYDKVDEEKRFNEKVEKRVQEILKNKEEAQARIQNKKTHSLISKEIDSITNSLANGNSNKFFILNDILQEINTIKKKFEKKVLCNYLVNGVNFINKIPNINSKTKIEMYCLLIKFVIEKIDKIKETLVNYYEEEHKEFCCSLGCESLIVNYITKSIKRIEDRIKILVESHIKILKG